MCLLSRTFLGLNEIIHISKSNEVIIALIIVSAVTKHILEFQRNLCSSVLRR